MPEVLDDERNHSFQGSSWIWCGLPCMDLTNRFVQARRVFKLERRPRRCEIRITADQSYRLYVNGAYVCRGPARGFQKSWPYDRVDIAPFLRSGNNVVAILAHSLGVSNFQYVHQGWAGLLVAGKAGPADLATGSDWKVRFSPGHRPTQARLSAQMGFQEWYDARCDDGAWLRAGYDDSAWSKPSLYTAGWYPWPAFEERGIPMLREGFATPRRMLQTARGRSAPLTENVLETYTHEQRRWEAVRTPPQRSARWMTWRVPRPGRESYAAGLLDFGQAVTGALRVRVAGALGGEVVDLLGTEKVTDGIPVFPDIPKDGNGMAIGSRLVARRGTTEHEFHAPWGLRYAVVIVRGATRGLRVSLGLKTVGYPLEGAGNFQSSDKRLNTIYTCCYRSLECCMLDAYVDCPSREQSQWWLDAHLMSKPAFYLANDSALLARGIRQIGAQQIDNGLMYGNAPTAAHNWILPDYTLIWFLSNWEYYWQTGDLELFRSQIATGEKALGYFEAASGANGLLPRDPRYNLYLEAGPVFKDGYSTLYALLYLAAVQAWSRLYTAAGDPRPSRHWAARARRLEQVIRLELFDAARKRFVPGLDWSGKPVSGDDLHNYAWAILTDILPAQRDTFACILKDALAGERRRGIPNPGPMHFVFEALEQCGQAGTVVDCIRRWWGEMNVDRGITATIEHWWENRSGDTCGSLCHAWSAHPAMHLLKNVAGIAQSGVGWTRCRIAPVFSGVRQAQGIVPTPFGKIESRWTRADKTVKGMLKLPAGIRAELAIPGTRRLLRGPCVFHYCAAAPRRP